MASPLKGAAVLKLAASPVKTQDDEEKTPSLVGVIASGSHGVGISFPVSVDPNLLNATKKNKPFFKVQARAINGPAVVYVNALDREGHTTSIPLYIRNINFNVFASFTRPAESEVAANVAADADAADMTAAIVEADANAGK